jgi:hypothetical protein
MPENKDIFNQPLPGIVSVSKEEKAVKDILGGNGKVSPYRTLNRDCGI